MNPRWLAYCKTTDKPNKHGYEYQFFYKRNDK